MTEIAYRDVAAHIQTGSRDGFSRVYLVFGEPYLRQRARNALIEALLPDEKDRSLSLEVVDTTEGEAASEAAERVGTFSFFSGNKVVILKAPGLFAGAFDPAKHLEKIRTAHQSGDAPKAARLLEELLSRSGYRPEDILGSDSRQIAERIRLDPDKHPDLAWLAEIAGHCRNLQDAGNGAKADDAAILQSTINRGLPKNHYLIISSDGADKRTGLYKALKNHGTVINCAVPTGARKAERDEQRRILGQIAKETLAPHRKSLDPAAFEQVYQRIGFDPGGFAASLEKLMLFAADRPRITADDAAAVLEQSREDPLFVFTGAIAERDADLAIYYLHSLLASGFHYMQLLSAMVNQIRRLIAVKSLVAESRGLHWTPGMNYDRFRKQVMPAVVEHDKALLSHVQETRSQLQPQTGGKKGGGVTDLVIAKNPKSPYPVYQMFVQSERFSLQELIRGIQTLHTADMSLKSTGQRPAAVLENAILKFCRPPEKTEASE